jgi:hypothetical protein
MTMTSSTIPRRSQRSSRIDRTISPTVEASSRAGRHTDTVDPAAHRARGQLFGVELQVVEGGAERCLLDGHDAPRARPMYRIGSGHGSGDEGAKQAHTGKRSAAGR